MALSGEVGGECVGSGLVNLQMKGTQMLFTISRNRPAPGGAVSPVSARPQDVSASYLQKIKRHD